MNRLFSTVLNSRLLIVIFMVTLSIAGVWSALRLPMDAVPDVTNVQVQINTNAAALSPLEVEQQITLPVELAMSGLQSLNGMRSLSKFGLSQVTVVFEDGTDIYFARQQIQERLQHLQLPQGIPAPEMGPVSTGLGEVFQYAVVAADSMRYTATELRTIQDWIVAPQLRNVRGVAEVNSFGGFAKQYQVVIRPEALQQYNVTLQQVVNAVESSSRNVGGGYMSMGTGQLSIRGLGQANSAEQIRAIAVDTRAGTPILIGDVADVREGYAIRQGAVTMNGEGEAVTGIVMMRMGENARMVVAEVKSRFDDIGRSLPDGVELRAFYDRTELISRTIKTVRNNLFEGALLVMAVLFFMLGSVRAAIVVALSIPLSMLFAVSAMAKMGIAGSLMSLGAIDFGLVVDGSVVMVENSMRRLSAMTGEKSRKQVILDACVEVGKPVLIGVGIIIAVYLPVLTLEGVEGRMFRPMAFTVVFALIGSLLVTFLATPAMILFAIKDKIEEKEVWLVRKIRQWYTPALEWTIEKRKTVLFAAALLVALAAGTTPFMGGEFLPRLDEGSFALQTMRLPGVSLEESVRQSTMLERKLMQEFPDEVRDIVSKTGRPEIATDPMGVNISDVYIMLHPRSEWTKARSKQELEAKMNSTISSVPGLVYSFSQPIELRVNELIAGVRSDIAIKVFGNNTDSLQDAADRIVNAVSRLQGATGFKAQQLDGLPELQLSVLPEQLSRYGVSADDVMQAVEAIGGISVSQLFEQQKKFDIVVRFDSTVRASPSTVAAIPVSTFSGERIPLGMLASVGIVSGPAEIGHENGSRLAVIEGNVRGRDIASFVSEARALFESGSITLPSGYYTDFGGQFENLERASARLMFVIPLVLLAIFVLLYAAFNSARQAMLVYTGIPLAAVGGIASLFVRGMPFSISAGVGFIALFGIAVLNGVVLVTRMNDLRERGHSLQKAVFEGAMSRLRPVLMTALVASFGFIPMALSGGAGAEVQRPLATVVVGGLITSTLLTLFVLPAVYLTAEGRVNTDSQPHLERL